MDENAVHVLVDNNGQGLGQALVQFKNEDDARKSERLHRKKLNGREAFVHVVTLEDMREIEKNPPAQGKKGLKRSVPGNPAVPGIPNVGMPNAGLPSSGMPSAGLPNAGMPNAGIPAAGMPNAGMPAAGMPNAGIPSAGMPAAGMPGVGMPGAGMPSAGGEEHAFLAVGSKEANSGPPFNFPGNFGGSNAFGPPLPPPGLGGAFGDARPGMPSVGNSGLPGLGLDVPGFGGGPNNLSGPGFGGGP